MPELLQIIKTMRDEKFESQKFQIRLAGGDPDESDEEVSFERVRARAEMRLRGEDPGSIPDEAIDAIQGGSMYMVEED